MIRKKLPIGIQTFREIREEGYYYVDKSGFAVRLATQGKYFFLSRPRRFGKSLFLDTLKELFEGNAKLFRSLQAETQWDWSVKFPVLRFSFGGGVIRDAADLTIRLDAQLRRMEEAMQLVPASPSSPERFRDLIRHCAASAGQRVVVLIDEYDKPILDRIDEPDKAREIREGLKDFYSVIKDSDEFIRFAFLTGVSKFSKVSLFSGLNNLSDITVDSRYSSVCGYTDDDISDIFAAELEGLDREEIRLWYNGYNWTGEAVYNPFDLLLLFDKRQFAPYWFETGTPTFLIKLLTDRQIFLPDLERLIADEALLSTFDIGDMTTEALLFQTGYLTIAHVEISFGVNAYRLGYPNQEVRRSLNSAMLHAWASGGSPQTVLRQRARLGQLLIANDFAGMQALFTAFFASIPHDWYRNNPIARYEGYWASVFYAYFAALGLDISVEDATSHGRIDMAVRFNGHVYLFEFKVVELEPAGQALAQLKDKGYADKYRDGSVPIHLIGVEFSQERRTVTGFAVETLAG